MAMRPRQYPYVTSDTTQFTIPPVFRSDPHRSGPAKQIEKGGRSMGTRIGGGALAVVLALGPWVGHDAMAAKPGVERPPVQGTFTDHFDSLNTNQWSRADGWKNGSPFDNAWRGDHVGSWTGDST
jgi:hypothetical protein